MRNNPPILVTSPADFLSTFPTLAPQPGTGTTARGAFLVASADFALTAEPARDNRYMAMDQAVDPLPALAPHQLLVLALREDMPVIMLRADPSTPDAVFPQQRVRYRTRQVACAMPGASGAQRDDIRAFFGERLGYDQIEKAGGSLCCCVGEIY